MQRRQVIITIDSLGELFKDYLGEGVIPADAVAQRLMINPLENGKMALEVASPSIPDNAKDIRVNFQLKRVYTV